MSYLGNEPQFTQYPSKFFNGDGTAMTVTLDYSPPNAAALLVFIDGVRQDTSAYTLAGTSLTFTGTVPSGTNNVQVVHMGLTQDVGVPSDDTITSAKIVDGAIVNADVNASAAIDATKIADGTVTSTEFQYINTLASNAQTQITARLPLAGGTMSGETIFADQLVTRPEIKDYAESVNAIGATGGGTQDIDLTLGNVVTATVDTSANTFTFSNPPATGKCGSFTLILTNGGSQTVNWPGAVDWAGGTAPTLTTAGIDVITFTTIDAGTIWYGFAAGLDMG
jgi:hypothetical protein